MSDIIFDLKNNDIGTSNGDFAVVVDPSIQNATLMLLKNPVNILQPQFGVGFETFALNARPDYVSMLAATAKRQVIKDGADYCDIRITEGENFGEYSVSVDAQYPVAEPDPDLILPTPPPPDKTQRNIEVRIAVLVGGGNFGYLSDVDIKINYTLPDGTQSDWLSPTSVGEIPDDSAAGHHDIYIWNGDNASLKQVTINVQAAKTGYHLTYSPYWNIQSGSDDVYFATSIVMQAD